MKGITAETAFADDAFGAFVATGYGQLSQEMSSTSPPIVTKTLSWIASERNEKSALIVMDGMSLFDFEVRSRYFICKNGVSFDIKGKNVMTHGGMSLDEVVVPFIKVKEVG